MEIRTSVGATLGAGFDVAAQPITRSSGETINPAASALPPAPPAVSAPARLDLKAAIEAGSKALQNQNQALEFQIDEKSHQSVVKVVDTQTNQVIRQMPSEEFLKMAEGIDQFQTHLLHEKA